VQGAVPVSLLEGALAAVVALDSSVATWDESAATGEDLMELA